MSVLIVAEHLRGQVRDVTRELITAGRELGPVTVAVIGQDPSSLVDAVKLDGVAEIVTVTTAGGEFENDAYQTALEALIADKKPRVTLLGFTVNSMGYGPAVAVKLGLGFASDVHGVALEGDAVFDCPQLRERQLLFTHRLVEGGVVGGQRTATNLMLISTIE